MGLFFFSFLFLIGKIIDKLVITLKLQGQCAYIALILLHSQTSQFKTSHRERNRFAFPKINLRLPPLLTCFLLQCASIILTFILFPIAVLWCGPPSTTHTAAVQLISWVALYTASSLMYR